MKDFKYIIKRIIIGFGIAFLLMLLRGTLFLQTHAKTTISGGLAIATPTGMTLENYDNAFYTNINYNPSYDYQSLTGLMYSFLHHYPDSFGYSSSYPDINTSINLSGLARGVTINHFSINFDNTYFPVELDKPYSIALKFTKDSHIDWEGLPTSPEYYSFNLYGAVHDSTSTIALNDNFVVIDNVGFYTYQQNNDSTNNGVFIINFHLSSEDYTYSYDTIYFTSLTYSRYDTTRPAFSNSGNFYPSILNNSTTNTYSFINKELYFINGKMLPYGEWCNDDTQHIGCGVTGDNPFPDSSGMDIVHDTDIEVFDELPTCDPLDIPCHINRVVKSIQDLFIRFGNFFREFMNNLFKTFTDLFIPSTDYMTTYINDSISLLRQKLGFLEYPIELLVSLLNRFLSLQKQTSFSYSGFGYPGTNHLIIPAFSFDFDSITNDNSFIAQMYSYYFILINGFLCLCFVRLCRKKLTTIGLGG